MSSSIKNLSREKLEELIKAFEYISSPLKPEEILPIVLEQISRLLNAEAGSIFLLNEKTKNLELKVATNLSTEEIEKIKVPIGKGLAGYVAEKDELVNIKDASSDNRFYSQIDILTGFHSKSILTVPLKTSEKLVGVIQALNKRNGEFFSEEDEILLIEFSRLVGLTLEKAWFLSQLLEKQIIETDLQIASKIQESLLPKNELRFNDALIKGFYKPARYISGDYYDFFPINDNEVLIVLGDVAGKGAQASLIMASTKSYLSAAIDAKMDFMTIANKLNQFLAQSTPFDKFITIFLGLINFKENKISYINCGHDAGLIVTEKGEIIELKSNNIMMGVLEDFEYISSEEQFPEHSFLFIYTDGVTEANNIRNERFGNERLIELVQKNSNSPLNIFNELPNEIENFSSGTVQFDDITFLMVIRNHTKIES